MRIIFVDSISKLYLLEPIVVDFVSISNDFSVRL